MDKSTSNLIIAFAFFALIAMVGCSHYYSRGPWTGKVIDAETKKPIEGAGVFAMWEETYAAPPGGGSKVAGAVETLTDKDGYFTIPSKWYFAMLPGGKIYGPMIKIFKPGYKCFEHQEWGVAVDLDSPPAYPKDWKDLFEKPGDIVELTKLKTREERIKNYREAMPGVEGYHKYKLYMNLINNELKELGLPIYPEK